MKFRGRRLGGGGGEEALSPSTQNTQAVIKALATPIGWKKSLHVQKWFPWMREQKTVGRLTGTARVATNEPRLSHYDDSSKLFMAE